MSEDVAALQKHVLSLETKVATLTAINRWRGMPDSSRDPIRAVTSGPLSAPRPCPVPCSALQKQANGGRNKTDLDEVIEEFTERLGRLEAKLAQCEDEKYRLKAQLRLKEQDAASGNRTGSQDVIAKYRKVTACSVPILACCWRL